MMARDWQLVFDPRSFKRFTLYSFTVPTDGTSLASSKPGHSNPLYINTMLVPQHPMAMEQGDQYGMQMMESTDRKG